MTTQYKYDMLKVDAAEAEALRAEREYLDHAKHALECGNSARALECAMIATRMNLAALEIHDLRSTVRR